MNILIEINPLDNSRKTGIGYYVDFLCRSLLELHPKDNLILWGPDVADDPFPEFPDKLFLGHEVYGRTLQERFWREAGIGSLPMQPDIYHLTYPVYPAPKPRSDTRLVVTIHDIAIAHYADTITDETYFRFLKECLPEQAQLADKIIVVSESGKQDIHTIFGIPEDKIRVIYHGCDLMRPESGIIPDPEAWADLNVPEKYLLCVGTWEPRKNLPNLFRAMQKLRTKCREQNIKLCVAGRKGWMYAEAEELIDTLDIRDILQPLGYVPRSLLPALYQRALLFAYPSLYEGFGLPVLEAMTCGSPVVTSNVSSLPEVAGDACLLVNPLSVEELASAMERLIDEEPLRQQLIEKGYLQAQRFSWKKSAREHLAVYHESL